MESEVKRTAAALSPFLGFAGTPNVSGAHEF
jgi:hypothetical protein